MIPLPLRHVPNFERVFGRNNTVQLFVSFDSEEAAGGNAPIESHHENGEAVDFSHEAEVNKSWLKF